MGDVADGREEDGIHRCGGEPQKYGGVRVSAAVANRIGNRPGYRVDVVGLRPVVGFAGESDQRAGDGVEVDFDVGGGGSAKERGGHEMSGTGQSRDDGSKLMCASS